MLRKKDSLVIKGVAVMLMMIAHCFLKGRADAYSISFVPFSSTQLSIFAEFSRIFVSFFAFVSGYGMYLSYDQMKRQKGKTVFLWIHERYLKSFLPMQFTIVFIWIVTFFIDKLPVEVYFKKGTLQGFIYMGVNFFGLSDLFNTPKMVGTWWYLSAHIAFIFVVPVLYTALKQFGGIVSFITLMLIPRSMNNYPGGTHFLTFIPALMIGMIFAETDCFVWIDKHIGKSGRKKRYCNFFFILLSLIAFRFTIALPKGKFWDLSLGLFTAVYIITIRRTICSIPLISEMFQFIGKHSANIFLTHTFIRNRYLNNFIYTRGHFTFVIFTLLLCSIGCSLIIESLKKLTKFNSFQNWILNRTIDVGNGSSKLENTCF